MKILSSKKWNEIKENLAEQQLTIQERDGQIQSLENQKKTYLEEIGNRNKEIAERDRELEFVKSTLKERENKIDALEGRVKMLESDVENLLGEKKKLEEQLNTKPKRNAKGRFTKKQEQNSDEQ